MSEQAFVGAQHAAAEARPPGAPAVYTRKATGLVRGISLWHAFVMNVVYVNIPLAVLSFTTGPFAFPGVNLFWSTVLTVFLSCFPVAVYALLAGAMPRSGGDYVWVSRILHPAVGFASNVNFTVGAVFFTGIMATWISGFAASSVLLTLGVVLPSKTLVSWSATAGEKHVQFLVGLGAIALFCGLLIVGTRLALRVTVGLFFLTIIGQFVVIGVLLAHSHADFRAAFSHYASYPGVLGKAHSVAGFAWPHGFTLAATLGAMPLFYGSFGYGAISTYCSGEVKSPGRTTIYATLGSVLAAGAFTAVLAALSMHVFSSDFLGAITSLAYTKAYPLSSQPFFYLFVSMLSTSTVLLVAIAVAFVAGVASAIPPTLMIATRNIFAWSFDRMVPTQLSAVRTRNATPVNATLVAGALMTVCMTAYLYAPVGWTVYLYVPGVMGLLTFTLVGVCGVLFPFRRREIYQSSPHRIEIAGVPLISLLGLVAVCYDGLLIYYFMTNKALGLTTTAAFVSIPVVFAVTLVAYYAIRFFNGRRGLSTDLAFAELPPE